MNVHIVSDGNPYNTKITDDNGDVVQGVTKVNWELTTDGSKLTLEFTHIGHFIDLKAPCCVRMRKFLKVIYVQPAFVAQHLNKGYKVCK